VTPEKRLLSRESNLLFHPLHSFSFEKQDVSHRENFDCSEYENVLMDITSFLCP
jgi:hypothetical protein